MEKRVGTSEDYPLVEQFYQQVCDSQARDAYSPDWHMGVYPSEADLKEDLEAGRMFLGFSEGRLAAVGALTWQEDPIYAGAQWKTQVPAEKVSVLHLFAVHPDFRGKGCSGEMLEYLFDQMRRHGCLVCHLDVMPGNLPAEKLYLRHGFVSCGTVQAYYDDIGMTDVWVYEKDLRK